VVCDAPGIMIFIYQALVLLACSCACSIGDSMLTSAPPHDAARPDPSTSRAGIADFWTSRVALDASGAGHITDVIPPDEYHDHVNDSVFTNAAAIMSLDAATPAAGFLGEKPDPEWERVARSLVVLLDKARGIHPEFEGYKGDEIKQADVVLLGYPLGLNMTRKVRANDLDYYARRTDADGPAMTWGMHSIGYLDLGRYDEAASLFNRSFANIKYPFGVWSETPKGGAPNFITGAGGFLQVGSHKRDARHV
jgi:protein-glucosylgalactosylhydroxylysine glucosidase